MKISDKQRTFAVRVGSLLTFCNREEIPVRFGDAFRSTDRLKCSHCDELVSYQELLFYNGRSKVKSGNHNLRLAIDLIFDGENKDVDCRKAGEYWESIGGGWGGRFGVKSEEFASKIGWDPGHFEWKDSTKG